MRGLSGLRLAAGRMLWALGASLTVHARRLTGSRPPESPCIEPIYWPGADGGVDLDCPCCRCGHWRIFDCGTLTGLCTLKGYLIHGASSGCGEWDPR